MPTDVVDAHPARRTRTEHLFDRHAQLARQTSRRGDRDHAAVRAAQRGVLLRGARRPSRARRPSGAGRPRGAPRGSGARAFADARELVAGAFVARPEQAALVAVVGRLGLGVRSAATGGDAASTALAPRPSRSTWANTAPTGTTAPSGATMRTTTPANGAGSSTVTLSVMTSTSGWSAATVSPSATNHVKTSPSTTDSASSGSLTSSGTGPPGVRRADARGVGSSRDRWTACRIRSGPGR